jgi:hypothetical protein
MANIDEFQKEIEEAEAKLAKHKRTCTDRFCYCRMQIHRTIVSEATYNKLVEMIQDETSEPNKALKELAQNFKVWKGFEDDGSNQ